MPATLKSRIPQITMEIPLKVGAAIQEGTSEIANDAAERAPVETGELRDSIEARSGNNGYGIYAAWYWFFGEFGTSHQPARPFDLRVTPFRRIRIRKIVGVRRRWDTPAGAHCGRE